MSDRPSSSSRVPRQVPVIPRGETVAGFETYPEAQAAVDRLGHAGFPVKQVSIVGSDLKSVEQVTGTLSYGRAALAGALSGVWIGIFFGLLFLLISPTTTTPLFLGAAALIGAGFGMFFNIVVYSLNRRRRDYTSVMQVVASSYALIVTPELANRARNLLDGTEQP
ncbi:general stress protein [Herbiconiux solani]|uniref:general stress protein n=1 Tax=Herbiconiux solani TaxID=661329 RepID=UPI000AC95672|nr:general stress protein [Herbiconiux solani]